jgi:hypothetical protein
MESTFTEIVSRVGTFVVISDGYRYTRRNTTKNKGVVIEYYYCSNREKCHASLIKRNGVWIKGKKDWIDRVHANHSPNTARYGFVYKFLVYAVMLQFQLQM